MATKKVKLPAFPTKFTAKSLGLVETPSRMLVPKEVMMPRASMPKEIVEGENATGKKKRGRPLGSKNKNPPKVKKGFS